MSSEERNLSPDALEILKLRYARMQAYKSLADVEAAEMQMLLKKATGANLTDPTEKWELDLERGVLKRVSNSE